MPRMLTFRLCFTLACWVLASTAGAAHGLPQADGLPQAIVIDEMGDTFGSEPEPHDLRLFDARPILDRVLIYFSFHGPSDFPSSGRDDAFNGYIDFDLDQDPSTGLLPWTDRLRKDGGNTGMGTDIYIDVTEPDPEGFKVVDASGRLIAHAPLSSASQTWAFSLPISLFDGDTEFNAAMIAGTPEEMTDVAPNKGAFESEGLTLQDRFRIEVEWRDFEDRRGEARLVNKTSDSAMLFFFSPENWEMLIKILDGCGSNGHYWVFFAATTHVEFTVTVTDTQTGAVARYFNPLGQPAHAVTDTTAFASCP